MDGNGLRCRNYRKRKHREEGDRKDIVITGVTSGKIVDYGIKDSMNMGAAMALRRLKP